MQYMAGGEGFEPPNARTKTWCLTTWPTPNICINVLNDSTHLRRARNFHTSSIAANLKGYLANCYQQFSPRMPGPKPGALPLGQPPMQRVENSLIVRENVIKLNPVYTSVMTSESGMSCGSWRNATSDQW